MEESITDIVMKTTAVHLQEQKRLRPPPAPAASPRRGPPIPEPPPHNILPLGPPPEVGPLKDGLEGVDPVCRRLFRRDITGIPALKWLLYLQRVTKYIIL